MKLLLVALLGALAMFIWEAVAHTVTPLGEAGISYLPNEDTVSPALASAIGDQRGLYYFPTGGLTKESKGQEKKEGMNRIMEEMKTRPSGLLVYKPPGTTFNFGKSLAIQFLTDFVKVFLAVWLLAQTGLVTFAGRLGFVVVVGVIAAIATNIPFWNWDGFPAAFSLSMILMEIVGFLFAGLVVAGLFRRARATA
jgi:hypothetical protein